MRTEHIAVTVAGNAGSASGSAKSGKPVSGILLGVYVDYVSQPATCDVTIATESAPVKTLLTLTNANTDGWFYPRYLAHGSTGTVSTTDLVYHPVNDYVVVTVAQGDAGSVNVYLVYAD